MPTPAQKILKFGRFELDPNAASCRADGRQLPLRPKSFDVLLYLARHPGRVVAKDELIEALWPGIFVTDNSLVQCISDIRAALKDEDQTILKTVARRGYLFAAPVIEIDPPPKTAEPERQEAAGGSRDSDGLGVEAIVSWARTLGLRALRYHRVLLAAGLGVAVLLAVWLGLQGRQPVAVQFPTVAGVTVSDISPSAGRVSIAVLPFVTLGSGST